MDTYTRFDEYVDLYDKYRLKYNIDVLNNTIELIQKNINISNIADIGSGTGILTRQLLKYKFDNYYALEPNIHMSEKSIKRDTKQKITHMNELSTETKLKTSSIDVIFVGTAIHWLEPKKTLKEFKRILKKKGYLVILTSGYVGCIGEDLYMLHKKYIKDCGNTITTRYKKGMTNYSNQFYTIISKKNIKLTLDEFIGLEMSMSTAPKKTDKCHNKYIQGLEQIFKKYSTNNKLVINNKTTALISNFSCLSH
jgi:ubiquinone/menaquinone biosynthesis C-methylase UbiE